MAHALFYHCMMFFCPSVLPTGPVHVCMYVQQARSLETLDLSANGFTGELPPILASPAAPFLTSLSLQVWLSPCMLAQAVHSIVPRATSFREISETLDPWRMLQS